MDLHTLGIPELLIAKAPKHLERGNHPKVKLMIQPTDWNKSYAPPFNPCLYRDQNMADPDSFLMEPALAKVCPSLSSR
jgi:hypothetical protein